MPSDVTERTVSRRRGAKGRNEELLFLVVEGARLEAGGMRISLAGVDELGIGRGAARALQKPGPTLRLLSVPDARMSTLHANLVRRDGVLHLVDAGSTNGTSRNGETVKSVELRDGDVIEIGQTLFLYREAQSGGAAAADLDGATFASQMAGLSTLDPGLEKRLSRLARVGASNLSTLLLGETGTGKEVLARALHALSRRPGPFVAVNCGAIPANLVEGQLFGHVKGAFSGAVRDELGFVRAANFGTLLLDEIGDLPAPSQAALLRVLQEGEVVPVGASSPIKVDVRILAATHGKLDDAVEKGTFRRDLYARLAGYTFALPPLRERIVDFGGICASLLATGRVPGPLRLHREAARAMLKYDWPMNVRELEQCLRASGVLAEGGLVTVEELPPAVAEVLAGGAEPEEPPNDEKDDAVRRELLVQMATHRGNVSEVARAMGKARQQIQRWVRRFGIEPEAFRDKS